MVGVAAGFAMEGFHPIAHSLSPFMAERPYEQLKLDFGYQGLGGTFVGVGGSYDYAAEGGTHHAPADAAVMLAIPGMEVLVPGHGDEVDAAARHLRERASDVPARERRDERRAARRRARADRGRAPRRGRAPSLAFGPMLDRTLAASEGLDVTVAYATSLAPFDARGLARDRGGSPRMVVVEPFYEGTARRCSPRPSGGAATLAFIGVPRAFIHGYGTPADLDGDIGLDVPGLRRSIAAAMG